LRAETGFMRRLLAGLPRIVPRIANGVSIRSSRRVQRRSEQNCSPQDWPMPKTCWLAGTAQTYREPHGIRSGWVRLRRLARSRPVAKTRRSQSQYIGYPARASLRLPVCRAIELRWAVCPRELRAEAPGVLLRRPAHPPSQKPAHSGRSIGWPGQARP